MTVDNSEGDQSQESVEGKRLTVTSNQFYSYFSLQSTGFSTTNVSL